MIEGSLDMDIDLFEQLLRHDEGVRLRVYDDATGQTIGPGSTVVGNPTIGVGRNIGPTGPGLRPAEVNILLGNDLDYYQQQAETFAWYNGLNDVRKTVVCCMIFNLGLRSFSAFTNTISAIEKGDWETAAKQMLESKWAKQVGERANRLAEMMRLGVPITR